MGELPELEFSGMPMRLLTGMTFWRRLCNHWTRCVVPTVLGRPAITVSVSNSDGETSFSSISANKALRYVNGNKTRVGSEDAYGLYLKAVRNTWSKVVEKARFIINEAHCHGAKLCIKRNEMTSLTYTCSNSGNRSPR